MLGLILGIKSLLEESQQVHMGIGAGSGILEFVCIVFAFLTGLAESYSKYGVSERKLRLDLTLSVIPKMGDVFRTSGFIYS